MIEALSYNDNAFITLTYADEHLPKINGNATVLPEHLNLFLKRLRYYYEAYQRKLHQELKINEPFEEWQRFYRFYAVAEYGGAFGRPHYHAILFNFPTCLHIRTRRAVGTQRADAASCCHVCQLVLKAWGKGIIEVGSLERGSAQYVCEDYITKSLRKNDDSRLLPGQHPEFSRMSRMPGIGKPSLWEYADVLMRDEIPALQDVPLGVRIGRAEKGMGRYLRQNLRAMIGREKRAPEEILKQQQAELLPLREAALARKESFKAHLVEEFKGQRLNHMAKKALKRKPRTL